MAEDIETPPIAGGIAAADRNTQNASARPSGQAEGGVTPRPGDPATPAQAEQALEADSRRLREEGFGDHNGGDF